MRPAATAGIADQPGRAAMREGTTFFPHQDARITSGAAASTASGVTMRSLAAACRARSGNTSSPPAMPTSSETQQPMPEISGSSHSLAVDPGARLALRAPPDVGEPRLVTGGQRLRPVTGIDQGAHGADHREDAGYVPLVEQVDRNARAGEVGGDVRLQVGEGEHEVRRQG